MKKITYILLILLLSCKTVEISDKEMGTSLLGVVFDNRNNPQQNVIVTISTLDDAIIKSVNSDIDGKFFIPQLPYGKYKIEIKAQKSLPVITEFDHYDVENVLIIKTPTFYDLVAKLENSLKVDDLTSSQTTLEELMKLSPNDIYLQYLYAIYFIKNNDFAKAETILISIKNNNYPYINLLLADLYQYHLSDNEKAAENLRIYLNSEYNQKEYERLKELENDKEIF